MNSIWVAVLLRLGALLSSKTGVHAAAALEDRQSFKSYSVTVKRELPHEGAPWTQGLQFSEDGTLVETVGAYPSGTKSFVRSIDPVTGKVTKTVTTGFEGVFLEGITPFRTGSGEVHWLATTYNDKQALELDGNLSVVRSMTYPLTGWGLSGCSDAAHLLATDGSAKLVVTCMGKQVEGVNELEYVEDFMGEGPALLGNIMNTRSILIMDPETAKCTGSFHLMDLAEDYQSGEAVGYHVANGIAYDKRTKTFYVTGKNWKKLFEVSLSEGPAAAAGAASSSAAASELLAKHLASAPEASNGAASFAALGVRRTTQVDPDAKLRQQLPPRNLAGSSTGKQAFVVSQRHGIIRAAARVRRHAAVAVVATGGDGSSIMQPKL
eukprot:TRINITY_DN20231_c0_g1_i3.p1 TRINITY_DN20231_c0_g1~~TRINITY_DN20231_c0_g1_i3.p1  ORF type:complete len:379 (-),score=89.87 TRINITY_DN20231_c0_g1_i3:64-1200(-)